MINTLTELVSKKREELQAEMMGISQELRTLSEGELLITKNGAWEKWYVKIDGKKKYIPKQERALAEKLARRKWLEARLGDLQQEMQACEAYLRKQSFSSKTESYLSKDNRYHTFMFPERPGDDIIKWSKSEYIRNKKHPEKLIFRSPSGNFVRSKSELIIDEMLHRYGIPYHYEEMLQLPDGSIYFPDFKIYSFKRQAFIYWEHLGLMDKLWYAQQAEAKVKNYMKNGIMPQDNLILTMETADNPLGYEKVESMIKLYIADEPCDRYR
ncbi:hypothetical protein SAMN02910358_01597 [Lachnospiraceae bacterium XBB1006]|nr:hypothetical protein SAMN02910358_01597 [Lachnospiraceae bacterium XBB1006]